MFKFYSLFSTVKKLLKSKVIMNEQDQVALNNIEHFGCHVLKVMQGEDAPEFTYSIGINKKQKKPDLIILGLDNSLAHSMINNYKDRLLKGEVFEVGKFYSDFLEGFDVTFIDVDSSHYKEYLGYGLWLHNGSNFKMLQMVWPTTKGLWPWDEGTSDYYQWAQPILNKTGIIEKVCL